MSVTRRVVQNLLFSGGSQVVTWVLTWVLVIMLPSHLGTEGFGQLFFAVSVGMMAGIFVDLGMNTYLVKETASDRDRAPELLAQALTLKLMLSAVVYGGLVLAVGLMDLAPEALAAARILGLGFMLGQLGMTFASFLNGLEMARIPAFGLIVEKTLLTGGCVSLLLSGYGLIAVAWMHVVAALGSLIFLAWRTYRLVPFRLGITREQAKGLLKGASPFLVWLIFGEIYVRIDVLMLASMTSESVVGWYGAAFRLYATLLFIPNIFMTTVFPALTRKFSGPDDSASAASRRTLNMMLLVSVPVGFGLALVARPVVALFFGLDEFHHSVENIEIFGLSIILVCVDVVLGSILIAKNRQRAWSLCAVGAAVLNPLMNLALIPWAHGAMGNGGYGAALATLATEAFMLVCAVKLLPKGMFNRASLVTGGKAILSGYVMVVVVGATSLTGLVPIILVGGVTYVSCALLLGVLPRADTAHLKHALLKRS